MCIRLPLELLYWLPKRAQNDSVQVCRPVGMERGSKSEMELKGLIQCLAVFASVILVLVVNLTDSRITWATTLWLSLWYIILIMLIRIDVGRSAHCGQPHSLARSLTLSREGERRVACPHSSLHSDCGFYGTKFWLLGFPPVMGFPLELWTRY